MESINHSEMKAKEQKNSGWKKKNMKNISKNKVVEAIFTGKVVFDKNPDKPMYYFEFKVGSNNILLSYDMLVDSFYFGIEKEMLPGEMFSWLCENGKI